MPDNTLSTAAPMDDLELITRFLNQQLDPEVAEQVRERLETDPDFYNLAEPFLFAWSVPRHVDRHPRPPGELEELWDKFTKRAGFVHQRQKARRRRLWILGIVALAIGISTFAMRGKLVRAYRDYRDFETIRADTGWIMMRDSNHVQLAPGARLSSSKRIASGVHRVRLEGSARFRVFAADTSGLVPLKSFLRVETRGGIALCAWCEFTVTTRADTTDVAMHRPSRRQFLGFFALPGTMLVSTFDEENPILLGETQAARMIRGRGTERTQR